MDKQLIGILGGTFDPIHKGHLALAEQVLATLVCKEIRFIPCAIPPHRNTPAATAEQRCEMVRLAIQNHQQFILDSRELASSEKSYTINTLKSLKKEHPTQSLCLIIGFDEFAAFNSWYEWENILDYCHLIVVSRPEQHTTLNETIANFVKQHKTIDKNDLIKSQQGKIFEITIPPTNISATQIRQNLDENKTVEAELPKTVYQYILNNNLYRNL